MNEWMDERTNKQIYEYINKWMKDLVSEWDGEMMENE